MIETDNVADAIQGVVNVSEKGVQDENAAWAIKEIYCTSRETKTKALKVLAEFLGSTHPLPAHAAS